jgi:hypothetical protein
MAQTQTTGGHVVHWSVGDRVYLAAGGGPVGTVTDVAGGGPVMTIAGPMIESARYCRVRWDGTPEGGGSWHSDDDLEFQWYDVGAPGRIADVEVR